MYLIFWPGQTAEGMNLRAWETYFDGEKPRIWKYWLVLHANSWEEVTVKKKFSR